MIIRLFFYHFQKKYFVMQDIFSSDFFCKFAKLIQER